MGQCCDLFDASPVPTDTLIRPFVQSSELLSRVTTYFSYDDIENAEVKGELMLQMSASNFLADLTHIKESASLSSMLKHNSRCSSKH